MLSFYPLGPQTSTCDTTHTHTCRALAKLEGLCRWKHQHSPHPPLHFLPDLSGLSLCCLSLSLSFFLSLTTLTSSLHLSLLLFFHTSLTLAPFHQFHHQHFLRPCNMKISLGPVFFFFAISTHRYNSSNAVVCAHTADTQHQQGF